MPFQSKSQQRACYAQKDPKWDCDKWSDETNFKKLPEKKKKPKSFKEWVQITHPADVDLLRFLGD